MDIQKSDAILLLIAVKYPGGVKQFKSEGGSITAIPSPSNDVIISHPNLPESLKDMFKQMQEQNLGQPEVHPVIQVIPNFEGLEHEEKREELIKLSKTLAGIWPEITIAETLSVLIVTAPNTSIKSERANKIESALRYLPGLSLAYIVMPKGTRVVKGDCWRDSEPTEAPAEHSSTEEQQLLRDEIERLINGL